VTIEALPSKLTRGIPLLLFAVMMISQQQASSMPPEIAIMGAVSTLAGFSEVIAIS
jgi:hypothetical protein